METGASAAALQPAQDDDACVAGASIPDILRLLGGGATGAILMALGEGPLRTMGLTQRVPGYTPRTVYRYAGRLAELDVVEREEEPGVPSKVVLSLSMPCGKELYDLVEAFATASLTRLDNGKIDAHGWALLGLLGDLWESGIVEELSCDPRSPTELSRAPLDLSYHQINRRASLFATGGLLRQEPAPGRRRRFALTEKARRSMALIAGIGRWRHDHALSAQGEGLTTAEMATVIRTALPLVRLPEYPDSCLQLDVLGTEPFGAEAETAWSEVEADGRVHSCVEPVPTVDGWARGRVNAWVPALLTGDLERLNIGGDEKLVTLLLERLHEVLWRPAEGPAPSAAR